MKRLLQSPALQPRRVAGVGQFNYSRVSRRAVGFRNTINVVHEEGLGPTHLAVPEPKSGASANSATRARGRSLVRRAAVGQPIVDVSSLPPCPAARARNLERHAATCVGYAGAAKEHPER